MKIERSERCGAPVAAESAERVRGGSRPFEVPQAARAAAPLSVATPTGHADAAAFTEAHVEAATAHLEGLPANDLALIREELRARMQGDLAALVAAATGKRAT